MSFFTTEEDFEYHKDKCLIKDNNVRPVIIPDKEKKVEFDLKHYCCTYMLPFSFVADFESTLFKDAQMTLPFTGGHKDLEREAPSPNILWYEDGCQEGHPGL